MVIDALQIHHKAIVAECGQSDVCGDDMECNNAEQFDQND